VDNSKAAQPDTIDLLDLTPAELDRMTRDLEREMKTAARNLEFEKAAALRDQLIEVRRTAALKTDPIKAGIGDDRLAILAEPEQAQ